MKSFSDIEIKPITFIIGLLYVVGLGVIYYLLFHKHHKRNKIDFSELISLITRFYTRTTIAVVLVLVGGYSIIVANDYREDRTEVIANIIFGIAIISATIINYIFYLKESLRDPNPEVREQNKKATIRIGEILEVIIFSIFILMPIWCIPHFISLVPKKEELIKELIIVFAISFASLFLMYALNPLDIKGKLKKLDSKKLK